MAEKEEGKKLLPPYVPYRTLDNFLAGIRSSLPQKVDRSLMTSMSGAMQSQTLLALEYLKLVNPITAAPTSLLERLVHAEGSEGQSVWQEILIASYPFLFEEGFQLERATPNELQDRFGKTGATGSTLRKCIAFFLKAAKNAGLQLSPYLTKISRTRTKTGKPKAKASSGQERQNDSFIPKPSESTPLNAESHKESLLTKMAAKILDKYPDFDTSWTPEQQASWFAGIHKLMEEFEGKSDGE